ncbi:MAG: GNAT family N-acetyltransferase, partial [Limnohabitans sp.]
IRIEQRPMPPSYETLENADPSDIDAIDSGLEGYNQSEPELQQVRRLVVVARTGSKEVCGGALGRTWGQCCELQQLWVSDLYRGSGVGTRLIGEFEQEAKARGCRLIYLDTFSFQARPFYEKHGYVVVLETSGFTKGIVKYTMHKRILLPEDDT